MTLLRTLRRRVPSQGSVGTTRDVATAPGLSHPLPPGIDTSFDHLEKADRAALSRLAATYGPIFRGRSNDALCVCVIGLPLGRRLLQDHAASLRPWTVEIESLVPKGFLRQMSGGDHLVYRRAIVRATRALEPRIDHVLLEAMCRSALLSLSITLDDDDYGPSGLMDAAVEIATSTLITLFFGASPGTPLFERLQAGYAQLGPHGLAFTIKDAQRQAFASLTEDLRAELSRTHGPDRPMAPDCVLSQLARDGDGVVDETMLGNLIYMVEMGRFDMQVFFRWLLRYGAANEKLMRAIEVEGFEDVRSPDRVRSTAEAFVLEVLRSDQAERLMRLVTDDIVFDGYLIPKGSRVRVCMWESHHRSETFEDPYRFDPDRFLTATPTKEDFAPFGVDNHQCPFGGMTIALGVAFLRAFAHFDAEIVADGPTIRGAYHWEASRRLRVKLALR